MPVSVRGVRPRPARSGLLPVVRAGGDPRHRGRAGADCGMDYLHQDTRSRLGDVFQRIQLQQTPRCPKWYVYH
ncbi:hypothetical protein [Bacteroides sp.]|uniref:hypothetical protein n=1 Tax=Bacteroides sp. TaxID=29523 RepID=UPI0025910B58|nr:hypothetical protein [Bacteroides sp.]